MKVTLGDTPAEATFSLRLSRTGRCLVWYGSPLGPLPAIESIDGYDPETKTWKCCAFDATGGHRVTCYSADAATAAEEEVFPSQYLQWQEYFSGHWIGEGNIGDDAVSIEYRARWAPGKHCLVFQGITRWQGESAKLVHWTLLSGCDVESREMVDTEFDSDGFSQVTRWTILSPSEPSGKASGVMDGKRFSGQSKLIKNGPDAFTFSTALPDGKRVKIEYKRVKEATK